MKNYARLMRMKHYIKNGLVLLPLFFGKQLFHTDTLFHGIIGFLSFCFISSAIYVFNDIQDVEKDRMHPTKRNRPIASGAVSLPEAWGIFVVCILASLGIGLVIGQPIRSYAILAVYFVMNLGYSLSWKHVPLVEIAILVFGFLLRLLYGAWVTGIEISGWLYLTIVAISFYLGLGKRRNEWMMQQKNPDKETRPVLKAYSEMFLNRGMTMFLGMSIVFYSLWAVNHENAMLTCSVPFVMLLALRYSMDVEQDDASGDPVEMIYSDRMIWVLGVICAVIILLGVYGI